MIKAYSYSSGESTHSNVDLLEPDSEQIHGGVPRHGHPSQPHRHARPGHIVSHFRKI